MKRALIIYATDGPGKRTDDDGAFTPESLRFEKYLGMIFPGIETKRVGIRVDQLPTPLAKRNAVRDTLAGFPNCDLVSFLCHGTKSSLLSFRFDGINGSESLGGMILDANPDVSLVVLYACSVATGPENFASRMFGHMRARRNPFRGPLSVFGHYVEGHTTKNPCVKIYDSEFLPFVWSKRPLSGYNQMKLAEEFVADMRNEKSLLRYRIPFTPSEIRESGRSDQFKKREVL